MRNFLKKIGFFLAFLLPLFSLLGYYWGGAANWLTVFFVFVLIPLFDYFIGKDTENVEKEQEKLLSEQKYYRFITFIWVYVQWAMLLWACYVVAFTTWRPLDLVGFTLGIACVLGGIGITVAHELGHKNTKIEQFYSQVLLLSVSYMHFFIEHNQGHHVHVATPLDPATSRKGENVYAFWLRSVVGSYRSAWKIENDRLRRAQLPFYHNRMIYYTLLPLLLATCLYAIFSWISGENRWQVPLFFVIQSILSFSLLELVNYIEHYGLQRKALPEGRYERVTPLHSWNASDLFSNFFLFQLQRHSDHHAFANRRYQILRHFEQSPQLPFGYPTMILIALVPPLWFALMNPKLEQWKRATFSIAS
jgi:alkane 1-monooxygenase